MASSFDEAFAQYIANGGVLPSDKPNNIVVRYNEQGQQEFVSESECESIRESEVAL